MIWYLKEVLRALPLAILILKGKYKRHKRHGFSQINSCVNFKNTTYWCHLFSSKSNFHPKPSAWLPKLIVAFIFLWVFKSESPVKTTALHWNSLDIFYFWSYSGTKIIIIASSVGWYKLLRTQKATSGKSLIAFQTPQEPRAHGNKYFWKVTFIFTQNRAKKVITVGKYFV